MSALMVSVVLAVALVCYFCGEIYDLRSNQ